jgi:Ras GTPase-activating-like protein IQGAP2/3
MIDITSMSYTELKRTALENIMKLERAGRISRHNYYQDILNAIALDIRTKSRRRVQRQRELEGVRLTLANLHEKAIYLEQQRKSYDNYIEQAMMTLQNKKGYVLTSDIVLALLTPSAKNAFCSHSPSNTITSVS